MTVLIFGKTGDLHIETVSSFLKQKNAPFVFCDLSLFPTQLRIGGQYSQKSACRGGMNIAGEEIRLQDIHAVWWDREAALLTNDAQPRDGWTKYIIQECQTYLKGLFYLLPHALWVSKPMHSNLAELKIYQLQIASALGFCIPETCMGNHPGFLQDFQTRHEFLVIKPLHRKFVTFELSFFHKLKKLIYDFKNRKLLEEYRDNQWILEFLKYKHQMVIPVQKIPSQNLEFLINSITACPSIIQNYVPKKLELRITIIGNRVFPCAIYSQETENPDCQIDFREGVYELRHEPYVLPKHIEDLCLQLMKQLDLNYGAIDMILTPEGEYVFLEINPAGQWLWIEQLTNMPISEAMADLLIQGK